MADLEEGREEGMFRQVIHEPPVPALQPDEFDAAAPVSVAEAAKAAGPAEASALYACPMHPEVRSDQPGKCPKCGMTLVKREKK